MIFVDTNVFLRFLVGAELASDEAMTAVARRLFEQVVDGQQTITTNEVVLHEVAYLLTSKGHYGVPAEDVIARLWSLLKLPNLRMEAGRKHRCLRAVDLWSRDHRLGFADALIAVTAIDEGIPLATFDRHFDRLPGLDRWQPA